MFGFWKFGSRIRASSFQSGTDAETAQVIPSYVLGPLIVPVLDHWCFVVCLPTSRQDLPDSFWGNVLPHVKYLLYCMARLVNGP